MASVGSPRIQRVRGALATAASVWFALLASCGPQSAAAQSAAAGAARAAQFSVGAAVTDFTPAPASSDAGVEDCRPLLDSPPVGRLFDGSRPFAFIDPYVDLRGVGHYELGDPYLDCQGAVRWSGNYLAGTDEIPRHYDHAADPMTASAVVFDNGDRRIAVEVVDALGLFAEDIARIRAMVAAAGVRLDGVYVSASHSESTPDTIGIYGDPVVSSINRAYLNRLVRRAARAIVLAAGALRPATVRFAEALQPPNFRSCFSSAPFTDAPRIPILQAVDRHGRAIATMTTISAHPDSVAFSADRAERRWISADWDAALRRALRRRFGGVVATFAGAVGSVESPEVYDAPVDRAPTQYSRSGSGDAACASPFAAHGTPVASGFATRTPAIGRGFAAAIARALRHARVSRTNTIWDERAAACGAIANRNFVLATALNLFDGRGPDARPCHPAKAPPLTPGALTFAAAFRIGDGTFVSLPAEISPYAVYGGFLGPGDFQRAAPLPPSPLPHMHTPYRFVIGVGEDLVGYAMPQGAGTAVPGEAGASSSPDGIDRLGCPHVDDPYASSSAAANLLLSTAIGILDRHAAAGPEDVVRGRYVLGDGGLSRDPLTSDPAVACAGPGARGTVGAPAVAVWLPGRGVVHPRTWMTLSGRRQTSPGRDTRGFYGADGRRHWLDVYHALPEAPVKVRLRR